MSGEPFFIGVDGGGSKTTAVVVDDALEPLGSGRAGPSNYLRVGLDEATLSLHSAIREACDSAGRRLREASFVYCGIAGSDHPRNRRELVNFLATIFPANNFIIETDARIALSSAIPSGPGVVVIAGTGSVAFGRNGAGEEARAGGWGPTLGDEGSGYSIARRGLAAVVRSHDGRGPETLLTDLLCDHYAVCEPDDLPVMIYAPTTHADDIALYGRLVVEAARRSDPVALDILSNAGAELGTAVVAVARRLGMLGDPFTVSYVGGAFRAGDLLIEPMKRTIRSAAADALLAPPVFDPAVGAARLAREAWNRGDYSRPRESP